jgi:hypothetical protein
MKTEFLKEWTPAQFKTVEKAISKYLNSRYFETHHTPDATPFYASKTFADFDKILGFAYTSSSSFAMYSICNTNLYFDTDHKWNVEMFAMSTDGFVFAILWDKDENEIIFPIN